MALAFSATPIIRCSVFALLCILLYTLRPCQSFLIPTPKPFRTIPATTLTATRTTMSSIQTEPTNANSKTNHVDSMDNDLTLVHWLLDATHGKTPGSGYEIKLWRRWSVLTITCIRNELERTLPTAVDSAATERLEFDLGVAADRGEMPSFTDAGSRSGYSLIHFGRSVRAATVLRNEGILERIRPSHSRLGPCPQTKPIRVCSIGGGPGYDHVAVALAATYHGFGAIHTLVLDYEPGWEDVVYTMHNATNTVLRSNHGCSFGLCDITESIVSATNQQHLLDAVRETDIFVCQYCVAENDKKLEQSNHVFFRELVEKMRPEAVLLLTETTHRSWPGIYDAIENIHCEVVFPLNRGRQMLVRKLQTTDENETNIPTKRRESKQNEDFIRQFRESIIANGRKQQRGIGRQRRKVRGAK